MQKIFFNILKILVRLSKVSSNFIHNYPRFPQSFLKILLNLFKNFFPSFSLNLSIFFLYTSPSICVRCWQCTFLKIWKPSLPLNHTILVLLCTSSLISAVYSKRRRIFVRSWKFVRFMDFLQFIHNFFS